jgi:hypothetical protein
MRIGFWWETQKKEDHKEDRRRWEDNIKMGPRKMGWGGIDWIDLAQDGDQWRALVIAIMNVWVS